MAVAVCAIFNYMAGVRPQMVTVADDHGKTKIALATCFLLKKVKLIYKIFIVIPNSRMKDERHQSTITQSNFLGQVKFNCSRF